MHQEASSRPSTAERIRSTVTRESARIALITFLIGTCFGAFLDKTIIGLFDDGVQCEGDIPEDQPIP